MLRVDRKASIDRRWRPAAPSRLTTCSHSAPWPAQCVPDRGRIFAENRLCAGSPWRKRTHRPCRRSIAGKMIMDFRLPISSSCATSEFMAHCTIGATACNACAWEKNLECTLWSSTIYHKSIVGKRNIPSSLLAQFCGHVRRFVRRVVVRLLNMGKYESASAASASAMARVSRKLASACKTGCSSGILRSPVNGANSKTPVGNTATSTPRHAAGGDQPTVHPWRSARAGRPRSPRRERHRHRRSATGWALIDQPPSSIGRSKGRTSTRPTCLANRRKFSARPSWTSKSAATCGGR